MLLDAHADDLQDAAVNSFRAPPTPAAPPQPGMFHNFWSSAGNYYMRGMAETARAVDLLGAVGPVAVDAVTGGTDRQDAYFREHDDTFNRAVDYWTPKPSEVGAAGQVVGSLGAGIVQFLLNPALLVGTAQLGTSEDLVRAGVSGDAALVAGDVAGLAAAGGIAMPIFGKTLMQRVAAGAFGNLATNVPQAALTQAIVAADGKPELAKQCDPWDARARVVDVLLGAVFGGKAHLEHLADAAMTLNAARHIEEASTGGRPVPEAELTPMVDATRQAIDELSAGRTVTAQTRAAITLIDAQIKQLEDELSETLPAAGNLAEKGSIRQARKELALMEQTRVDQSDSALRAAAKVIQAREGVSYKAALAQATKIASDAASDWQSRHDRLTSFIEDNAAAQQQTQRAVEIERQLDALRKNRAKAEDDAATYAADVRAIVADHAPDAGPPIEVKSPDAATPAEPAAPTLGKPRDLRAEVVDLRKTDNVLRKLLECIA